VHTKHNHNLLLIKQLQFENGLKQFMVDATLQAQMMFTHT